MHHFKAPASKHPDTIWGPRLPWKLGSEVKTMEQGWGIHLVEGPDWPLFWALMATILVLTGLIAGLYSWKTGDSQTGVAVGAWLTAVQGMATPAVFFWTSYH